ncbi:MAG: hypothetical protein RBR22_09160 [Desulfuromonas sp.]|nr:hypothetical protein [Desulfuromonas sp.]
MRKSDFVLPETESQPTPQQGVDYSPKTYSLNDQIIIGIKMATAAGLIGFIIWLLDKFAA